MVTSVTLVLTLDFGRQRGSFVCLLLSTLESLLPLSQIGIASLTITFGQSVKTSRAKQTLKGVSFLSFFNLNLWALYLLRKLPWWLLFGAEGTCRQMTCPSSKGRLSLRAKTTRRGRESGDGEMGLLITHRTPLGSPTSSLAPRQ